MHAALTAAPALAARPAAAGAQHHQVHPLRACQLCAHQHTTLNGDMQCWCQRVIGNGPCVPCTQARLRGGGCGPDALHMQWLGGGHA